MAFDNVLYQSTGDVSSAAPTDPRIEMRRSAPETTPTKNQQFKFSNLVYQDQDSEIIDDRKVDLSETGITLEEEEKDGMRGFVNPYSDLPEEEKRMQLVVRTNSTTMVMGESKAGGGLTSLDTIEDSFEGRSKSSPRPSPRGEDDAFETKTTLVEVHPSHDLTAFADLQGLDDFLESADNHMSTQATPQNPEHIADEVSSQDDLDGDDEQPRVHGRVLCSKEIEAGPQNTESLA